MLVFGIPPAQTYWGTIQPGISGSDKHKSPEPQAATAISGIMVELDSSESLNLDSERLSWVPYIEQATPAHIDLDQRKSLGPKLALICGRATLRPRAGGEGRGVGLTLTQPPPPPPPCVRKHCLVRALRELVQHQIDSWARKHAHSKGAHLVQCARSASAMQLFGRVAVLRTHTL